MGPQGAGKEARAKEPHTREDPYPTVGSKGHIYTLLNKDFELTQALQRTGGDGDLECLNPHSTCPAHGWPGPFECT